MTTAEDFELIGQTYLLVFFGKDELLRQLILPKVHRKNRPTL